MVEYSRAATWEDVIHITRLLQNHGAEFILVGGYALQSHGFTRTTFDVDIAVDPKPENARKWVLALSELPDQAAKELLNEDDPFKDDPSGTIRINDEITVDVMPCVAGIPFAELRKHATEFTIHGVDIPILSMEGLYLTKQGLRAKDQADAEILRLALARLNRKP